MKTIGLLGGMSWESTALYYQLINEGIKAQLGGLHSAKIVLVSVDFHEIEQLQHNNNWLEAGNRLSTAAQQIEAVGAEFLLICTNTMHKVADQVQAAIDIPLLHLADATATRITERGIQRVGLLGTRFTMEQDFYSGRLQQHGLEVITPSASDREIVHRVIYDELCLGTINEDSRKSYLSVIDTMHTQGAQAVIEGCTEITLLVKQQHTDVPLFDTTAIHAEEAVRMALA
jgi:aspartate racemase